MKLDKILQIAGIDKELIKESRYLKKSVWEHELDKPTYDVKFAYDQIDKVKHLIKVLKSEGRDDLLEYAHEAYKEAVKFNSAYLDLMQIVEKLKFEDIKSPAVVAAGQAAIAAHELYKVKWRTQYEREDEWNEFVKIDPTNRK